MLDNAQASTSHPFSLLSTIERAACLRGHDTIRSVCVLGPSSMPSYYVKASAGLRSGLKPGPARPGPLALNAARPGLKRGPAFGSIYILILELY